MQRTGRELGRRLVLMVLLLSAPVAGCDRAADRLSEVLYPSSTPQTYPVSQRSPTAAPERTRAKEPTSRPTPAPTSTSLLRTTPIPEPSSTAPPTAAPTPTPGQHLVFARGNGIYRGDSLGGEETEVATVPPLEAWAFNQGLLATAWGREVRVIDLQLGSHVGFQIDSEAEVEYAEVSWGSLGKALLHVAIVSDAAAPKHGRSVELRVLAPEDGDVLGMVRLRDVNGASVLRYDEVLGHIALIPVGEDPAFVEVQFHEVKTGELVGRFPASGEGEAVLSPDGGRLLTQQFAARGTQLVLYDLSASLKARPRAWALPQASHAASLAWSPDGERVAFLLREGSGYADESTKGLGLWVLDAASMEAQKVLDEDSVSSVVVGWIPDGTHILAYRRDAAEESFYYAVRPDGGDRRILTIGPDAQVLGWMLHLEEQVAAKVVIDLWPARFLDVAKDSSATAAVVAEFVAGRVATDESVLTLQVREYLERAGWEFELVGPAIRRVSEGTFLAQLPPMSIHLLESGRAQLAATGDLILDARRQGDDLGLVYGVIGASAVQPGYVVYRRSADGTWVPLWTPQGQRDWVTTDGEIRFIGQGLEKLWVAGSSFGLDYEDDIIFSECHACPHRRLVATWTRQDDVYVRDTELPENATRAEVLWEMTERSAYAVLHECLRRLRRGESAEELVAGPDVLAQIEELGLLDQGLRLIAEEERVDDVLFSDAERRRQMHTMVRGGRIVRVEALGQ